MTQPVPQWWNRPADMTLQEWADLYNAAHPMPHLETLRAAQKARFEADMARIDALLAQAEAAHLNTLKGGNS
jgi:hypothetical protein